MLLIVRNLLILVLVSFSLYAQDNKSKNSIQIIGPSLWPLYINQEIDFEITSAPDNFKIEDISVNAPYVWAKGCTGLTLDYNKSCKFTLRYNSTGTGDGLQPAKILIKVKSAEHAYDFTLPVSLLFQPVHYWSNGQETSFFNSQKNPKSLLFPYTKNGDIGDAITLHLENLHNRPLVIKKIITPSYISVEGCVGKLLNSQAELQKQREYEINNEVQPEKLKTKNNKKKNKKKKQNKIETICLAKLKYSPKNNLDIDGTIKVELSDETSTFELVIPIHARPWSPLKVRKAVLTTYKSYLLLDNGTFWKNAELKLGWELFNESVDDFGAQDESLLVKKGKDLFAMVSYNEDERYGKPEKIGQWQKIAQNASQFFGTRWSSYYWTGDVQSSSAQLFQIGRNVYYDYEAEKKTGPFSFTNWTQIQEEFVSLTATDEALYGIDKNSDLWVRGQHLNMLPDGSGMSTKYINWTVLENNVDKFEVCNYSQFMLNKKGELFFKGFQSQFEYVFEYVSDQKISDFSKWILIAEDVKSFAINCDYNPSSPSFKNLFIIKKNKSLFAVGDNSYGILNTLKKGIANKLVFITDNVASVSANEYYAFIVKNDGTLWLTGRHHFDFTKTFGNGPELLMQVGDFRD